MIEMGKTDKVNQVEYSSGGSCNRNNQKRKKQNAVRRRRKANFELKEELNSLPSMNARISLEAV